MNGNSQLFSVVHCMCLYNCLQVFQQDEEMSGDKEIEDGHTSLELCVQTYCV